MVVLNNVLIASVIAFLAYEKYEEKRRSNKSQQRWDDYRNSEWVDENGTIHRTYTP